MIDGGPPRLVGDELGGPTDTWRWVRIGGPQTLPAGRHDVTLRVREHGVAIDRLVLTTDSAARPD